MVSAVTTIGPLENAVQLARTATSPAKRMRQIPEVVAVVAAVALPEIGNAPVATQFTPSTVDSKVMVPVNVPVSWNATDRARSPPAHPPITRAGSVVAAKLAVAMIYPCLSRFFGGFSCFLYLDALPAYRLRVCRFLHVQVVLL